MLNNSNCFRIIAILVFWIFGVVPNVFCEGQAPLPEIGQGMPFDQEDFIIAVKKSRNSYTAANNDMAKGAAVSKRKQQICNALRKLKVNNWIGNIEKLSSTRDGKGILVVQIEKDIRLRTHVTDWADSKDKTLIPTNSILFQSLANSRPGQQVFFSGSFFTNDRDCVEEKSLTMEGSIMSPEFLFKFSDIKVKP